MPGRSRAADFLQLIDRAIEEGRQAQASILADLAAEPFDRKLRSLRRFGLSLESEELAQLFETESARLSLDGAPSEPGRAPLALAATALAVGVVLGAAAVLSFAWPERWSGDAFYEALARANGPAMAAHCRSTGQIEVDAEDGRKRPACLFWLPEDMR